MNSHINYSNICVLWKACKFCAFGKKEGQQDAYAYSLEEIFKMAETLGRGRTEFHMVGGLHPDLPFDYYLEMIQGIKEIHPQLHLKSSRPRRFAGSPIHVAKMSVEETLEQLVRSGLGFAHGRRGGDFRRTHTLPNCKGKHSGEDWLEIHRIAHNKGIRSTCTMLYGHVESNEDRVDHMLRLRDLPGRNRRVHHLHPARVSPENTQMDDIPSTGGMLDIRNYAVGRLLLDNIPHIKAYWIMWARPSRKSRSASAWTIWTAQWFRRRSTNMAGAKTPHELTVNDIRRLIREAGREPIERDTLYREVTRQGDQWAVHA